MWFVPLVLIAVVALRGTGPRKVACPGPGLVGVRWLHATEREGSQARAAERGAAACFVLTDVCDEDSAQQAFAAATAMGTLRGLVNCAGVAPAEKVVGRDGAHKLASFTRTIHINLIGSFNMIRLAAEIMSTTAPDAGGERGVDISTPSGGRCAPPPTSAR